MEVFEIRFIISSKNTRSANGKEKTLFKDLRGFKKLEKFQIQNQYDRS
jgi:hypothetical protein